MDNLINRGSLSRHAKAREPRFVSRIG